MSRVTVTRWKKKGILIFSESGKIDVTQTDKILDESNKSEGDSGNRVTKPSGNKSPSSRSKRISKSKIVDEESMSEILDGKKSSSPKKQTDVDLMSKYEAEEMKENYLARLRKLEYEVKAGKLVEAEPLRKTMYELWRRERDALMNLPSRVSAEIAAALGIDQNQLTILLEKHINEFLHERADQPRIRLT